ncbi:major tail protein [Listeria monocytogenes]|uniref:major tail protein n=1 Tax=Listeria monocytogenes TaxID=1639 RepID=UPI000874F9FF|nr:major tail protein [Listeria monocytogenes]EAC7998115.1 phage tail protein [Listeria monocytogenes]EAC8350560.1 phage tail protein [Listeria monocytogenes]EAD0739950.1 phage tail protein [Listeria monocytogenes]EAD9140311.1 phage tail protein [Listeria monocytogenes]EIL9239378.1 phage tail protein [Listeria monocytogenes]
MKDTTTGKEIIYPVGIDDLLVCVMVEKETINSAPVYDAEIWRLPVIVKLGIKGNGSTNVKYASNKLFARVSRQTEHELTLDYVSLPTNLYDRLQGITHREGISFETTGVKEMPYFALGFIGELSDGSKGCTWYPRVQLSNATELEYESTDANFDFKDLKITMTASGLVNNGVLYSQFNPLRNGITNLTFDKFISKVVYDEKIIDELITP